MVDTDVPDSVLDGWDSRYERVKQCEENTEFILKVESAGAENETVTKELDINGRGDLNRDSISDILEEWIVTYRRPIQSWEIIERSTVVKGGWEDPQTGHQLEPKLDDIDDLDLSEGEEVTFHQAGPDSIYGTRTGIVKGATTGTGGLNIRVSTDSGEKQIKPEWVVNVSTEPEDA